MLIPVSQTCRRLRSVALGCPSLWKDVVCGPRLRSHYLIDRSCGLPLTVILSASQAPSLHFGLADVASALRTRIGELYIVKIPDDDTLDQFLSDAFPMLESLAVKRNSSGHYVDGTYANAVQLSRERVPRLRRLAYSMFDLASLDILASLTHLALNMVHVGRMHEKIAAMLSVFHALRSLHLDAITLVSLDGHLIIYILSLLREITPLAVQIHHVWRNITTGYPVILSGYPDPHDLPPLWGITLCGSERTARWAGDEDEGIPCMFCEGDPALTGVRELWLADVSPATCDGPYIPRATTANQLRALIQGMSALETIVLHGYGKHVLRWWTERPDPIPAMATGILEELASGAYSYVQHLVIEVPFHVPVDAGDVERLREHCNTVQIKTVVDVTPTISLPAYCYERAAWAASDDPWPYKLW
ncbi:uncharacterized protein TRAVEDRAFT_68792 [Trametes versicolor FP-101664 SS1]|uniref:uncharacterized protein n=1 Tax=Trametes versicolor (strain FP-101664) TaxID=717944 RepID=UPI00046239F3|nr:uncharacterized protein TRAVEDRAFT_68792 [Trametes versicolor FP-101664 SS1]EIW65268.1 hypothetical protein TRAVEDRAFT_68792 [Trametes versicolor FP-101664 SS1]